MRFVLLVCKNDPHLASFVILISGHLELIMICQDQI
jgi:hypothetical protein